MSDLKLYYEEQLIGLLHEGDNHEIEFTYESSWLVDPKHFSISASLPLSDHTYKQEAHRFFSNLLPEGDIRSDIARNLGISVDNDFRLLQALGGECAGALTVAELPQPLESRYIPLEKQDLKESFLSKETLLSVLQGEEQDVRLSLAGAQDKLPVYFKNGDLFLPQGNSPSSHILKPPSHQFKYLPENECLMGMYAEAMGLQVASSQLIDINGISFFLIDRYDRKLRDNQLTRLHQEDFCQALSYSYKVKYQKDGGPSFNQCFEKVENRSFLLPEDSERMLKWLIFNLVIGNCDAHAKNISFIMREPDVWALAPHYDLVCTKAYPRLSKNLAMGVSGSFDSGTITGTHWRKLAQDVGVKEAWLLATVREMADGAMNKYEQTELSFKERYGDSPILSDIKKNILIQCRRLLLELKK